MGHAGGAGAASRKPPEQERAGGFPVRLVRLTSQGTMGWDGGSSCLPCGPAKVCAQAGPCREADRGYDTAAGTRLWGVKMVRPCAGDDKSKRRGDVRRERLGSGAAHLTQLAGARHVPLGMKKPRRSGADQTTVMNASGSYRLPLVVRNLQKHVICVHCSVELRQIV